MFTKIFVAMETVTRDNHVGTKQGAYRVTAPRGSSVRLLLFLCVRVNLCVFVAVRSPLSRSWRILVVRRLSNLSCRREPLDQPTLCLSSLRASLTSTSVGVGSVLPVAI